MSSAKQPNETPQSTFEKDLQQNLTVFATKVIATIKNFIQFISPKPNEPFFIKSIRYAWLSFFALVFGILVLFKMVEYNFLYLFGTLPPISKLENPKIPLASEVYTSDGKLIGKYFRENRSMVHYRDLPLHMVHALVATEDVRFYDHSGIDLNAIFGVVLYTLRGDRRGGSTLTQQLAKNMFKTRMGGTHGYLGRISLLRTPIIKIKEWITAINLEENYTKEEIIEMYLNTVDFGNESFGVKIASKTFFNKHPRDLSVQEAAVLVGVLKATTSYNPLRNPEKSLQRRNVVLQQMLKYNYLSQKDYDRVINTKIETRYTPERYEKGVSMHFHDFLSLQLEKWCEENDRDLYADGLKIYTTIDSRLQKFAEEAVAQHMSTLQGRFFDHWRGMNPWTDRRGKEVPNYIETEIKKTKIYQQYLKLHPNNLDSVMLLLKSPKEMKIFTWKGERDTLLSSWDSMRYYKHILHTGMMSMEPYTGQIKAWVGDINYQFFKYDNVRQARRQPGSTFKPFVYATAFEAGGMSPCSRKVDRPVSILYMEDGKSKTWSPHNADWQCSYDTITLKHAMGRSLNTITAQITQELGWDKVIEYAHKIGIKSPMASFPSVCLGANDVTVYEMTAAYSTFMNDGVWTEPQCILKIEDKNGKTIYRPQPKRNRAISPETAFLMRQMLRGSLTEPMGTSGGLWRYQIHDKGMEVGGKTGTSSNHADGWYMGVTKDLVTGVWVGGDDLRIHFRTGELGEGAKMAMPIFGLYTEKVYNAGLPTYQKGGFTKQKTGIRLTKNYQCRTIVVKDSTKTDKDSVRLVFEGGE
jgi:penicillin-binding protein 1A